MESLFGWIQTTFPHIAQYKYLILFLATSLEGFNTLLVAGFLISSGNLSPLSTFVISFLGEMLNSFMWYSVGYWGGHRTIDYFFRKSGMSEETEQKIRWYLERYTGALLLITKLTWSITIFAIMLAGSIRYNFKRFTFYNVIGSFGWVIITLTIGYSFGRGYQLYLDYFRHFSYLVVLLLLLAVILFMFRKFSRGMFLKTLSAADRVKKFGDTLGFKIDDLVAGDKPAKKDSSESREDSS